MTTDMAQWSDAQTRLSALVHQLDSSPDTLPEPLAEQLQAQADLCLEADLSGSADLLALLAELIDAEPPDITLSAEQREQLQAVLALLPIITTAANKPDQQASALATLSSPSWQAPLETDDLEALTELLQADRELLAEQATPVAVDTTRDHGLETDILPVDTAVSPTLDSPCDPALTTAEAAPSTGNLLKSASTPEALEEQLQTLAEPLTEADNPLPADLVALAGELIGSCESLDLPVIQQITPALTALIDTPERASAAVVIDLLSADSWPDPLDDDDIAGQRELLDEVFPRAEFAIESTTDVKVPVPVIEPEQHTDASLLDTADSPETLTELLATLAEPLSDGDNPLLADLVALAAELIGNCDSLQQAPISRIKPLLHELIETPSRPCAETVLDLLGSNEWPEPLDEDDIDDLRNLLDDTFGPDSEIKHAVPESEPDESASITESAPQPFCQVDMSLLEQAGPSVDPSILTMLTGSLQALQEHWVATGCTQPDALLEASLDALTPLARACATVNLTGLNLLLTGLSHNLTWFSQHPDRFQPLQCEHFADCLQAVHHYLDALADKNTREDLIDAISDDRLPIHADPQQAAFISGLLALASIQSPDDLECETATAEDVALTIGDEIDPQLMEMLYDELPVLVEEFQQQLQAVLVDHEADALLSAQRAAHTIKGLANMAGIRGIANLTHHLEDILEVLTDAKMFPGPLLTRNLTEASDCLAQMSESVTEETDAPGHSQQQLQQLMTWFYRLQTEGIECAAEAIGEGDSLQPAPQPAPAGGKPTAAHAHEGEKEHAHLRVGVSILDNLFRIAGESSTLNAQLDDTLTQLRRLSRSNRERQRSLQKVLFDLEQQLQDHFTLNAHLNESDSDFDPLEMDRYNAMHTTLSQLQEAVADVREVDQEADHQLRQLAELHVRQSNLQKESLDNVLHTRLVAVKTISSRMQRIMRQACTAAGKEAQLVIEGEDVLMDSQILNQLADPLMHIIRNAVDHGLETPHLRFEAGKDETGTLTICFSQRNGKVHVSCEDDGAGINLQRVRQIAENKSLISHDAELSDRDIQRLILVPGFSTRDEISQLSGRGIGMDVVSQQIMRMQGTLNIHSEFGTGTRFELSMPASSLLVHTLLVRSAGKRIFALASHTVEQSLLSLDGEFKSTGNGMVFITEGEEYPAYTLESLIGEAPTDYQNMRIHPVLLVTLDQGEKAAVLVREVMAHREVVFKPLGEHLPDIAGISGVTILANGDVSPIVDLPARIIDRNSILGPAHDTLEPAFELRLPHLLVVDDSLSARKTLATLLSDSGYQVSTAIDGLDALDKVRSDPPELILTDLEMPRMTGMELAAIIRNSKQFSNIPVIMITSRSTNKHRGEAEVAGVSAYLTKPWTEANVLEQVQSLLF